MSSVEGHGLPEDGTLTLDELNVLPATDAAGALARCCAAPAWVSAMAAGRPYSSVGALVAHSDRAVAALTEADLRAALDGHPRIGERPAASAAWSREEQAGVTNAGTDLRPALAEGNAAYEERFGHIYLVCATGRSGAELLAFLRERLGNEPAAEWRIVAAELAKINRIRLRKLLGAPA